MRDGARQRRRCLDRGTVEHPSRRTRARSPRPGATGRWPRRPRPRRPAGRRSPGRGRTTSARGARSARRSPPAARPATDLVLEVAERQRGRVRSGRRGASSRAGRTTSDLSRRAADHDDVVGAGRPPSSSTIASTMASGETERDRPAQDPGERLGLAAAARLEAATAARGGSPRPRPPRPRRAGRDPRRRHRLRAPEQRRSRQSSEEGAGEDPPGPADPAIRRIRGRVRRGVDRLTSGIQDAAPSAPPSTTIPGTDG